MPDTFEDDLASCFDEQYKQNVADLEAFVAAYRAVLNAIHALHTENSKNPFECELLPAYKAKYDLFMERAQNNVTLLRQKIANPAQVVELPDLTEGIRELNEIIEQINVKIRENNAIIADRSKKQ